MTTTIRKIVLHHHEHWDGSGYPDGLARNSIPLQVRIVSLADVYTSLRAKRSYKPALTRDQALLIMEEMAGRVLDPCLVEDFERWIRLRAGAPGSAGKLAEQSGQALPPVLR